MDQRIFKYWIELRNLEDGSVRVLPVQCFRCVALVKEDHPMHGKERVEIRVEDGGRLLVGENFDEIAGQLRTQYADGKFERFLKAERDKEAELKREAALENLAMIFARAAVDSLLKRS